MVYYITTKSCSTLFISTWSLRRRRANQRPRICSNELCGTSAIFVLPPLYRYLVLILVSHYSLHLFSLKLHFYSGHLELFFSIALGMDIYSLFLKEKAINYTAFLDAQFFDVLHRVCEWVTWKLARIQTCEGPSPSRRL